MDKMTSPKGANAGMIEGSAPTATKDYATNNGWGKSLAANEPTAANKRGVEAVVVMKDSLGLAHTRTPTAIA